MTSLNFPTWVTAAEGKLNRLHGFKLFVHSPDLPDLLFNYVYVYVLGMLVANADPFFVCSVIIIVIIICQYANVCLDSRC